MPGRQKSGKPKRASGPSGKHKNPRLEISGTLPELRDELYEHTAALPGGFARWARERLEDAMKREREGG